MKKKKHNQSLLERATMEALSIQKTNKLFYTDIGWLSRKYGVDSEKLRQKVVMGNGYETKTC